MIHLFNSRGRILFFPVKWANAVASWILGLHSPSGTIRVSNTANPSESGGATVDVDMEVVAAKTKERLTGHFQTKREVEASIERAADGSSIVARDRRLHVSEDWLKEAIGETAATVDSSATISAVGSTASAGSATKAAPSDHVHNLKTDTSLAFDASGNLGAVFGTTSGTVAEGDHNHDADYADIDHNHDADYAGINHNHDSDYAAANHNHSGVYSPVGHGHSGYAASNHTHTYGDGTLTGFKASATKDFDTTGGTMAYDSKIKTLANALNSDGKVKTSSLTCDVSGHSNNCLLVASGTTVTHSGNTMYDMLNAATEQVSKRATKIITDKDKPHIPGASGGLLVKTTADGEIEESDDEYAHFTSAPAGSKLVMTSGTDGTLAETSLTASKWMMTDANGNPSTTDDTPIAASKSLSGVVYNEAGAISYKPINGANGVAGLNSSSKLAIDQIPTGTTPSTVALGNHVHAWSAITDKPASYTPTTHSHTKSEITDFPTLGTAAELDVGESGGVQEYSAPLTTLANALSSEGKVKTSSLTCDVSGHSNNCLLVASGTTVTHSGNTMYDMLNAATEQVSKRATKIITDKDKPYIPGASGGLLVKTTDTGEIEESDDIYAAFTSEPSGSKLVLSSGSDGNLAEASLGNGLQISDSKLSPKFKSSGGITADSGGLKLDSVGSASTTLNPVQIGTVSTRSIELKIYGIKIDANGRVIGLTSTYTSKTFYPGL